MVFPAASLLRALIDAPMRSGTVAWVGVRPKRRAPMQSVHAARLTAGRGVEGDHYASGGKRQVTLIALEDIAAVASFLGRDSIPPELLRRNIVTRGINLAALKDARLRIGEAILEATGDCAPCSRMEEALGVGGYNAMRGGRGGITARVLTGGLVSPGDRISREAD